MEQEYPEIRPRLLLRQCGGWLAAAPKWSPFSIAVTAPTEVEAREAFTVAFDRWVELAAS